MVCGPTAMAVDPRAINKTNAMIREKFMVADVDGVHAMEMGDGGNGEVSTSLIAGAFIPHMPRISDPYLPIA